MTDDAITPASNVTPIATALALPDNPLEMRSSAAPGAWCRHERIVIDVHQRSITCANPKCAAVLDAFDFLAVNGSTVSRAWAHHAAVMRQAEEVAQRVHDLRRQEANLRATIGRLQKKSGAVIDVRGQG